MKRILFILAVIICSLSAVAETYTIVFNSGDFDSTSPTTDLSSIILSATNNCVSQIITANKIYRAKEGYGIKGGTGSEKGELTLGLDDTYTISTLTVYAAAGVFAGGPDTAASKRLIVCGQEIAWEAGHRSEIRPYTIQLNQSLSSISIAAKVKSSNRWYVQKIEFESSDPHPTQAILEMQYPTMNFGGVKWEGADVPLEDVLSFDIAGKNISGNITLSLKKKSVFTLSQTTLPATGGEVDIYYSITLASITSAIPYSNTVVATAKGKDGVTRTRELDIQLTVVPPGSGTSTFDLDTTRMAIGPMPPFYYQYAQGTADSTLKNHIGYIICCGKRYRYGSGTNKTWDAFFHTDRDTLTNQVLDM